MTLHASTKSYTFPFDTCEPTSKDDRIPVQPYSFSVNLASTLMLLSLATCVAQTTPVAFLLFVFAVFEAWHTLSHAVHLKLSPSLQNATVHAIGYVMFIATYAVMDTLGRLDRIDRINGLGRFGRHDQTDVSSSSDTGRMSSMLFLLPGFVLFDLWVFRRFGGVYSIASGLAVYTATVAAKFHVIPDDLRPDMWRIMIGTAVLVLLFVNEAVHGRAMLRWRPWPFHAVIEVLGLYLFWELAQFFLSWERLVL